MLFLLGGGLFTEDDTFLGFLFRLGKFFWGLILIIFYFSFDLDQLVARI